MAVHGRTHPKRIRLNGNTLPEYMLIAVLMLGIFTTSFLLFGKSFKGSMQTIQTNLNAHKSQALVSVASIKAQKAIADAKPKAPAITLTYNEAGQLVPAPVAFTSGANGSSMAIGSTSPSDRLLADGITMSMEQQNLFRILANQAHRVARLEGKLMELSLYSGSDIRKFKNTPILLDGKVLNANQISRAINDTRNDVNRQTRSILSSGVDRNIASQVALVSNQVADHASNLSKATNHVLSVNGSPFSIGGLTTPHETHEDASFICEKGHRRDNGQECE